MVMHTKIQIGSSYPLQSVYYALLKNQLDSYKISTGSLWHVGKMSETRKTHGLEHQIAPLSTENRDRGYDKYGTRKGKVDYPF